jgi:hypothetical protein
MVQASKLHECDEAEETVTLKRFLPDREQVPHPTILLAGKRFAGKSTAAVALAKYYDCPRYAAWCGTKDTEDFWAERFGSSASVWGPDDNGRKNLTRIIAFQERMIRKYKKVLKLPFPDKYTICLIFDDVTANKRFSRGELLSDLFSNGRHYKAVIIISCQYMKQLPPEVRGNTDYIVMLHNTKKNLEILHDEYVENPNDLSMFIHMLKAVINQRDRNNKKLFNALVYNNCTCADTLDGMFFVFRHEDGFKSEKVELGSQEWREAMQENHVDRELEEEEREQRKKKRKHRLDAYLQRREQRPDFARDVDYFSDSDHESDEETSDTDCFQVQNRKGKGFKLVLENPKEATKQPGPIDKGRNVGAQTRDYSGRESALTRDQRPRQTEFVQDNEQNRGYRSERREADVERGVFGQRGDRDRVPESEHRRAREFEQGSQHRRVLERRDDESRHKYYKDESEQCLTRDRADWSRTQSRLSHQNRGEYYAREREQDSKVDRRYPNADEPDWSKHRPCYPHLDVVNKPVMSWVDQKNFVRRACVSQSGSRSSGRPTHGFS